MIILKIILGIFFGLALASFWVVAYGLIGGLGSWEFYGSASIAFLCGYALVFDDPKLL